MKIEKYWAITKDLYLKRSGGKKFCKDVLNTLGEECSSFVTVTNCIANFKRKDQLGKKVSVSTLSNIEAVNDLIFSDRRIWLK